MKILFITPYYYPNLAGGSERSLKIFAEGLVKKKVKVTVLSFDGKSAPMEENHNGVKVLRVKNWNIKPNTLALNFALLSKKYLIEKESPDIIHVYNTWQIPFSIFIKGKSRVVATLNNYFPIITTSYTTDNLIEKKNSSALEKFRSIFKTLKGSLEKRIVLSAFYSLYSIPISFLSKRIDNYTVYSEPIKDIYVKNGFDKDKFVVISSPFEDKKERGINLAREKSALYVGGVMESKGFYEMFSATRLLKDKGIKVYFVGVKSVPDKIREIVKKEKLNAKFIEPVNKKVLDKYYQKAGVFVRPALWPEPFARVWIEALENNTPIISSDSPVAKKVLEGVIFYRRNHAEELAKKIELFLGGELKMNLEKAKKNVFNKDPVGDMMNFYNKIIETK
jgi:glycosyltransferase involved in cell wall biosynthesis